MTGKVIASSLALLIAGATLAYAGDPYAECVAACNQAKQDCIGAITLFDKAGIDEAKKACNEANGSCRDKCRDIEDVNESQLKAIQQKQAEEAERQRQEQEIKDNGNIRTYQEPTPPPPATDSQPQVQEPPATPEQQPAPNSGGDNEGIKTYQPPAQDDNGGIKTYKFDN